MSLDRIIRTELFNNLKELFLRFDIEPGSEIDQKTLELVVNTARLEYGGAYAAIVMDCFDPAGANAYRDQDGYTYYFDTETWLSFYQELI